MTSVTRKFTPTNDQIKKENKNSLFPPYHASRTSLIKFPMNTDIIEWYHPDLTIVLFVTSQHEDYFFGPTIFSFPVLGGGRISSFPNQSPVLEYMMSHILAA